MNFKNSIVRFLLILVLLSGFSIVKAENIVLTMTTTLAKEATIKFSLDAWEDNTTFNIDYGDGKLVATVQNKIGSEITGKVKGSTIKVYSVGALRGLTCQGQQITSLVVANSPNIIWMTISDNLISSLDVTKMPGLKTLQISGNKISSLDLSKNPILYLLHCSRNNLSKLDLKNNLEIQYLEFGENPISSIDLTMLTKLASLAIYDTKITSVNLSKNVELYNLVLSWSNLISIDLSTLTKLQYLSINNNNLTTLNVTKNTKLLTLNCSYNKLSSIDISKNTAITNLDISNNYFTFATLPQKQSTWKYYSFEYQENIQIPKNSYKGSVIDLSSQYSVGGVTTTYVLYRYNDESELKLNTDYTLTNGKIKFLKAQNDSVTCRMTNALFSGNFGIYTTRTYVGTPTAIEPVSSQNFEVFGTSQNIKIKGAENSTVFVYDLSGKNITNMLVQSSEIEVPMSKTGIFLVKIKRGNEYFTEKVFVK